MYRTADPNAPRCTACGGSACTPPTKFDPTKGWSRVYFRTADPRQSYSVTINRARICMECGHVMFGVDSKQLGDLGRAMPMLVPNLDS